uniref:NB-ARC domain-containing protein n=1 Tax=Salix viminalis TaxID=40686 RepID=A0A6N2L2I6_SALVM
MGGVGKTTLLQHIYNELLQRPDICDHVWWVTVSQDFTINRLQNLIAKRFDLDLSSEDDDPHRAAKLSYELRNKQKWILILDDLWNSFELYEVGIDSLLKGCKLILTTRSQTVCAQIDCQHKIEVKPLFEGESWTLFKENLGRHMALSDEVKGIAKDVARECDGLPLGIITVAGSLRGVDNLNEWRSTLKQLRESGYRDMDEKVFKVLRVSYDRLGDGLPLQKCLLYCALFPEDDWIAREELIDFLIDDGIIEEMRRQDALDKGHTMLNRLEYVSLLEGIYWNKYGGKCVKMHDLIRDMAIKIQQENSQVLNKAGAKLEELPDAKEWAENLMIVSLMQNKFKEIPPNHSPMCPDLSTLLLRQNHQLRFIADSFFKQLHGLKVLNLSHTDIENLPESISDLVSLTALLLNDCGWLRYVPSLEKLRALKSLDLYRTSLEKMPQGMECLSNLRYFRISGCGEKEFPSGILPKLSHLQVLALGGEFPTICHTVEVMEVGCLGKLETLECHFKGLSTFMEYLTSRDGIQSLSTYKISVGTLKGDYWYNIGDFPSKSIFLGNLSINRDKDFQVKFLNGIQGLYCEYIDARSLCDVLSLENTTELEIIDIEYCNSMESLVSSSWFYSAPQILPSHNGMFSRLKEFHCYGCDSMENLFPLELLSYLVNLEAITVTNCEKMEEIIGTTDEESRTSNPIVELTLPKLTILYLRGLPELKGICRAKLICNSLEVIQMEGVPPSSMDDAVNQLEFETFNMSELSWSLPEDDQAGQHMLVDDNVINDTIQQTTRFPTSFPQIMMEGAPPSSGEDDVNFTWNRLELEKLLSLPSSPLEEVLVNQSSILCNDQGGQIMLVDNNDSTQQTTQTMTAMRGLDGTSSSCINQNGPNWPQTPSSSRQFPYQFNQVPITPNLYDLQCSAMLPEPSQTLRSQMENLQVHVLQNQIGRPNASNAGLDSSLQSQNRGLNTQQLLQRPDICDHVWWVTVSQDFSINRLQNLIAKRFDLDLSSEDDDLHRAAELSEKLRQKQKWILILDDLWNNFEPYDVGIHPSLKGCKLILTTRSQTVCDEIGCQHKINVKPLLEGESWTLFEENLRCHMTLSDEVKGIAKDVARECAGLPLGIITVAGSLRGVDDPHQWRNTLKKLKDSGTGDMKVFKLLRFSYDVLGDSALQQCLLYCALFPEDHKIEREELIDYLIDEGIIKGMGRRQDTFDEGHTMLNRLQNVCLLESAKTEDGGKYVKMHDLIRDMAIQIMQEKSEVIVKAGAQLEELPDVEEYWTENLTRVSLMINSIEEILPSHSPMCPNLVTLFLSDNGKLRLIADSFFKQFHGLKVLDLSYTKIQKLPESISDLVSLTALLLTDCWMLRDVPSLKKLTALKRLDLFQTKLETMPQGMECLTNLRCLRMNACCKMEFPSGVLPKLSRLQVLALDMFLITVKGKEVGSLRNLETLECHFEGLSDFVEYLRSQNGIRSLTTCKISVGTIHTFDWKDLDYFPSKSILLCNLNNNADRDFPIKFLNGIQGLACQCIDARSLCDVLSLESATELEIIRIVKCDSMESLFSSSWFCPAPLPSPSYNGIFSSLQEFYCYGCRNMKNLFPLVLLPNLANLKDLIVEECAKLEEIIGATGSDEESREFKFPKLRWLRLSALPKLKRICSAKLICDSLQFIEMENLQVHVLQNQIGRPNAGLDSSLQSQNRGLNTQQLLERPDICDHVWWVTVSQDFSINRLQNLIAKRLYLDLSSEDDDSHRASKLSEELRKKQKWILILDDLWNSFELHDVGIPVPLKGCKLIMTTRSKTVCHQMACQHKIKVKPLYEDESWTLFMEKLGHDMEISQKIEGIAKDVVRECDGLPLGIITIAKSLRGVDDLHEWSTTLKKLKELTFRDMDEKVFKVLRVSYDRLDDGLALKHCLLYCALYPEDHKIKREELIGYLIDEGIIKGRRRQDAFDEGHTLLNKLQYVCLLESDKIEDGGKYVKMHDLIRDMAIQIMQESSQVIVKAGAQLEELPDVEEWTENLTRVSLMQNEFTNIPPSHSPMCPNLSTILLCQNHKLQFIANSFFKQFHGLTVLDLSYTSIENLPESISDLVSLIALLLIDCSSLGDVPSLKKLKALQKLDLSQTKLDEMPQGMECLSNLSFLVFVLEEILNEIYDPITVKGEEVGSLRNLETLECHFEDLSNFVEYLRCRNGIQSLSTYRISIGITDYYNDLNCFPSKTVWLGNCNINANRDFQLMFLYDVQGLVCQCIDARRLCDVLSLESATELEIINVQDCDRMESLVSSSWFSSTPSYKVIFFNLHEFYCSGCRNMKNLFPVVLLPNLVNLERIEVSCCEKMEEIIGGTMSDEESNEFKLSKLRYLSLIGLPELKSIYNAKLICDSLKVIEVSGCDNMEILVPSSWSCLVNLEEIFVASCAKMKEILGGTKSYEERVMGKKRSIELKLPQLRYVRLQRLPELKSISNEKLICESLERIVVVGCHSMEILVPSSWNCLANLKEIKVVWCVKMEEIIGGTRSDEEGVMGEKSSTELKFPKLRELTLWSLPELKTICSANLICDSQVELEVTNCEKLKWEIVVEWEHPNAKKVATGGGSS